VLCGVVWLYVMCYVSCAMLCVMCVVLLPCVLFLACKIIPLRFQFTGPLTHHTWPPWRCALSAPSGKVRQSVVYGYGILAEKGGEPAREACVRALPHIRAVIENEDAREDENLTVTDNAVAAFFRIGHAFIQPSQFLPEALTFLPIETDTDEARPSPLFT